MSDEGRRSAELTPDIPGTALVVLVLEDDETDRRRLIKFMNQAGLQADFHEAQDLEGLAANLSARRFDLIYVDYHLGLATGREALDLIFARPDQEGAIAIMVTSVETPEIMAATIRAGCADYLVKDRIRPESLGQSLINSLERQLLLSSLDCGERRRDRLRQLVRRFDTAMSPPLRLMTCAMLRRTLKLCSDPEVAASGARAVLESFCLELVAFLERASVVTGLQNEEGAI